MPKDKELESLLSTPYFEDVSPLKRLHKEEVRALIEAIPQFIWIVNLHGALIYSNQRWLDYIAMTPEQAYRDSWMKSVHSNDIHRMLDAVHTVIHSDIPYEWEQRLQDSNGMYHWFLIRGTPIKNEQGIIQSWIGTSTNIDQQKHDEERIRAYQQSLHGLTETMPQFFWTTQADGHLDYMNQSFLDWLQADFGQVEDYEWYQFVHPDDLALTLLRRQQSFPTGELYECEYRLRNGRTGEYRWFLARAQPMRDEAGQIIRWFGTSTNIDQQKRTEEALRQSQERVQALMNSNVIGIFCTQDDKIQQANDTFLHMTGYSQEDLHNRQLSWLDMTAPEYIEMTLKSHQQFTLHQYMTPYEKEYITKDGGRIPVVIGGVTTQIDPPQEIYFVLDNSARKELEQRKDAFLSMASHELKTPLTALKLQTQMLKKQLAKCDQHRADIALARIDGQLDSISRLVKELFDLSNIQNGRLEYAHETVDLDILLQKIVEMIQQAQTTHTLRIHGALNTPLVGDRDRLGQVFLNLINNAIKYSPYGDRVDITISTTAETVTISIRDYGIGISPEQRDKIFERFYRVPDPKLGKVPGLGIGLYIVAEIVRHHQGTITVESEGETGSTFQVTLPLAPSMIHVVGDH
jgi:PAS domain S-box-containing protein